MKTLLTAFVVFLVLAMAVLVLALECPDDSLNIIFNDGTSYAFSYTCDNGTETRLIVTEQNPSEEKLIEALIGKDCLQFNDPTTGEMKVIICK